MAITSRQELKDYALRALGAPVVEINVDDDQLEDRIDEALEYWNIYHYDGIEKMYLKHRLKASELTITTNNANAFEQGVTITGQTSGATARVTPRVMNEPINNSIIPIRDINGEFVAGETVTSGANSAIIASSNFLTIGDFDKKYIELPDIVFGVVRVLPFSATSVSASMFDIQYQLRLHDLYDLTSTSIIYYKMVMGHLSMLDMELNAKPSIEFNRLQGRVYPKINWDTAVKPGDYMVIECYRALDPTQFNKVWNETWLKRYVIALFKRQWAYSIKKFSGIQLPGGVTLNGQALYDEAIQEINQLEEELIEKQAPLSFFLG